MSRGPSQPRRCSVQTLVSQYAPPRRCMRISLTSTTYIYVPTDYHTIHPATLRIPTLRPVCPNPQTRACHCPLALSPHAMPFAPHSAHLTSPQSRPCPSLRCLCKRVVHRPAHLPPETLLPHSHTLSRTFDMIHTCTPSRSSSLVERPVPAHPPTTRLRHLTSRQLRHTMYLAWHAYLCSTHSHVPSVFVPTLVCHNVTMS
jgi:hypothetical protein